MWGSGPVIPITVIKFEAEQDGLYLAPNFDFHRFPMILAREPPVRDPNQQDQRAGYEMDPSSNKGSLFQIVDCRAKTVKGGLNPSPKKRLFGGIPGITAICPLKKPKP